MGSHGPVDMTLPSRCRDCPKSDRRAGLRLSLATDKWLSGPRNRRLGDRSSAAAARREHWHRCAAIFPSPGQAGLRTRWSSPADLAVDVGDELALRHTLVIDANSPPQAQGAGTATRLSGTIIAWYENTSRLCGLTVTLTQCTSLRPLAALSPNVSTRVKFSSR